MRCWIPWHLRHSADMKTSIEKAKEICAEIHGRTSAFRDVSLGYEEIAARARSLAPALKRLRQEVLTTW